MRRRMFDWTSAVSALRLLVLAGDPSVPPANARSRHPYGLGDPGRRCAQGVRTLVRYLKRGKGGGGASRGPRRGGARSVSSHSPASTLLRNAGCRHSASPRLAVAADCGTRGRLSSHDAPVTVVSPAVGAVLPPRYLQRSALWRWVPGDCRCARVLRPCPSRERRLFQRVPFALCLRKRFPNGRARDSCYPFPLFRLCGCVLAVWIKDT